VIVVLEAAAATHGDEPRISDLGEDHSLDLSDAVRVTPSHVVHEVRRRFVQRINRPTSAVFRPAWCIKNGQVDRISGCYVV
jgi:hypothetical protein